MTVRQITKMQFKEIHTAVVKQRGQKSNKVKGILTCSVFMSRATPRSGMTAFHQACEAVCSLSWLYGEGYIWRLVV